MHLPSAFILLTLIICTAKKVSAFNPYTDAFLFVTTTSDDEIQIGLRNSECVQCDFQMVASVNKARSATIRIDTDYPVYYIIINEPSRNLTLCHHFQAVGQSFGEAGNYSLYISNSTLDAKNLECHFSVVNEPTDRLVPIYVAVPLLIVLWILIKFFQVLLVKREERKRMRANMDGVLNADARTETLSTTGLLMDDDSSKRRAKKRLDSVDTLRGLCLCIMIFVNYGAGEYGFFDHSIWNGLHLADLVFPCFMLIMGISLPLSFNALCNKSRASLEPLDIKDLIQKMFKRAILLFLFGILTSNGSDTTVSTIRIFGVLQRFAISYLVCATMEIIHLRYNGFIYETSSFTEDSWKSKVKEIVLYPLQWLTIAIFVLVWLLITFLLPVPGCPTGYLGPGGLHEHGLHENCTGGAAGYIDRLILGESHVYQYPTCRRMYQTKIAYDPEGILGCLTSCVMTYLGVCIGHVVVHYQEPIRRVIRFLVYATIYGVSALILCKCSRDDGWIPINKNLWSLSFILALASIGLIGLVFFYLLMDVWNLYAGKPFIYPGKNSICIYICHEVFQVCFPVQFQVPDTHSYRLAMHLWGVVLWVSIAAIMDSKKVYINL